MPSHSSEPVNRLIYAQPDHDPDIYYLTGFHAPDPFLAMEIGGRIIGVISSLEYNRARQEGRFDEVLSREEWLQRAREEMGKDNPAEAEIIRLVAREYGAGQFLVPPSFPVGIARQLQGARLPLEVGQVPFLPARVSKSDAEAGFIRAANAIASAAFAEVEKLLGQAKPGKDRALFVDDEPLTSERLRRAIQIRCLCEGGSATDPIVAGGDQACDPHERGYGPLCAGELIIVDIFPRLHRRPYFGDMTRTYLKGSAKPEQRKLVETVREGQQWALEHLSAGADGRAIHQHIRDFFAKNGFPTEDREGVPVGFFHGTGHGLGLALHEYPRVSPRGPESLPEGAVVTVEPGLYYPGLGGCRIEDVVRLQPDGAEMLSDHPYHWEID